MKYLIVATFTLFSFVLFSHGKDDHVKESDAPKMNMQTEPKLDTLKLINDSYVSNVKKIFTDKCSDCHGDKTTYPWYFAVPGIKQLISTDIEEARKHIDVSNDFPFGGHGEFASDLDSIQRVIEEESMPPFIYSLAHRTSKITTEEKQTILMWVKNSKELLNNKKEQ